MTGRRLLCENTQPHAEHEPDGPAGVALRRCPGVPAQLPRYVIVHRRHTGFEVRDQVHDVHLDEDLDEVCERAALLQHRARQWGRGKDSYRVAQLRYLDTPGHPGRDQWSREDLLAVVAAAYAFADELAGYCSPHGVSFQYAERLRGLLDQTGGAR